MVPSSILMTLSQKSFFNFSQTNKTPDPKPAALLIGWRTLPRTVSYGAQQGLVDVVRTLSLEM